MADMAARGIVERLIGRMPRWLRAVLAVAAIALGAVLVLHLTTAIGVLAVLIGAGMIVVGVLELAARGDDADRPRWRLLTAALWIAAGIFILAWPGLTVRVLAVVVGLALIVNGVLGLVAAFRRAHSWDARVADAAFGIAGIVFGVLALAWPDITLLIVAVVFGARLVMGGLAALWRALRPRRDPDAAPAPDAAPRRRWGRAAVAIGAVALSVAAAWVSVALHGGSPVVDGFYAAPRSVPDEPGRLIRSEPFTREVPDGARAWRILYTTTDGGGAARVASGIVVVPTGGDGDWPVIDWNHGTTGFAQQCAPSLVAEPFESGALFVLPEIIAQGWAVVATDYIGLGTAGPHPYLVGLPTAHASLDAVRAARELAEADLGAQTVVWGHSQGGGGALWTGAVADEYAPDVPLAGVAALAPAGDPPGLIDALPRITGGSIFASFAVAGYTGVYDDVTFRQYVRPGAEVTVRAMAQRCLSDPGTTVSVLTALGLAADPEIFATDPTSGVLGARLEANVAPATITAPLLLGQGAADSLISVAGQDAFVTRLCDAGQQADYRRYTGRDHLSLVAADSPAIPDLLAWTTARFAGEPVEPGCTRSDR